MMKKEFNSKSGKRGSPDPVYFYIFFAAAAEFVFISLYEFVRPLYEYSLMIPAIMVLGILRGRGEGIKCRGTAALSFAMVAWFLVLQIRRALDGGETGHIGLFFCTYLFAFPLASLLKDGDKMKALKIFAAAYLAAAGILAGYGLLLCLDRIPAWFYYNVCWDGGRLQSFWHPNTAACFFMIGIIFATTFFSQTRSRLIKAGFLALIILLCCTLALTCCRTAIILTGGYFGALLFFAVIRQGWKWFIPGVAALLVIIAAFYSGAMGLYRANYDVLLQKMIREYSQQMEPVNNETEVLPEDTVVPDQTEVTLDPAEAAYQEYGYYFDETADYEEEYYANPQEETLPFTIDPVTGEVTLTTVSPQGSLIHDIGNLNSRTDIWRAMLFAIEQTPSILFWGVHNPGEHVSLYFYPPVAHLHNAWMECLAGMGVVGFLMALMFTGIILFNCLILLWKHHQQTWKRNVALLLLCLLAAAFVEPYLFYTVMDFYPLNMLFFLCAGYLLQWQQADNRWIGNTIRRKLTLRKK